MQVVLWQLPNTIKEFVTVNPDATYTVVINENLSYDMRIDSYLHALKHIENNDFDNILSADEIEQLTHDQQ